MARKEADLSIFTMASDYDPAHYYNWTEKELAALGNCKATAEVMKKHLGCNGTKVMEMYVIEHKDEKTVDSKSEEHHKGIDETKPHFHLLVKFEKKHGATLKVIAKYIGVRPEAIEKPKSGGYSYDNMLSYLTHIKYEKKIQYKPEDVVTLAGANYTIYYDKRKESWINGRNFVTKKGGKSLDRLFQEAVSKMKSGELFFDDLAAIPKYRKLLFESEYMKRLQRESESVKVVAKLDCDRLCSKIQNGEITTLNEITASDEWKLAYMYHQRYVEEILKFEIAQNKMNQL